MCFCICILVSCLCWNDGILVTASWDSTVKVSLIHLSRKIFRDAAVSFSCVSMEVSWRKWLTSFNRFDYLDGFRLFHVYGTVSVFYLVHSKVWKFFPEPDGKKPSPPEILVKYAC